MNCLWLQFSDWWDVRTNIFSHGNEANMGSSTKGRLLVQLSRSLIRLRNVLLKDVQPESIILKRINDFHMLLFPFLVHHRTQIPAFLSIGGRSAQWCDELEITSFGILWLLVSSVQWVVYMAEMFSVSKWRGDLMHAHANEATGGTWTWTSFRVSRERFC